MNLMRSFALTPGRLILLIVFFLVSGFAAVLAYLPAAWVWDQIRDEVRLPPEIIVEAVGGTVWSGASLLKVQPVGTAARSLRLTWNVQLPSLDQAAWPVKWRLESRKSWLEGEAALLGTNTAEIQVGQGQIVLSEFADIARQNGLTLPGTISVDDLEFQVEDQQLVRAQGRGRWGGGTVAWQMGNQSGEAQLPPFIAELQEQAGGVALDIRTETAREKLVDLSLSPAGTVSLAVRRRLLQLSDMQSGNEAPDDVVIEVQHRVLQ